MINVTFQFDTLQDLHDFTAKMAVPVQTAPAVVVIPTLGAQATSAVETPAPKARKPKAAPAAETPAEAPIAPHTAAPALTLDDVRAAIAAVNDKFGLVPARRVLKKFSVARVTELKPEQYADFIKACVEVK